MASVWVRLFYVLVFFWQLLASHPRGRMTSKLDSFWDSSRFCVVHQYKSRALWELWEFIWSYRSAVYRLLFKEDSVTGVQVWGTLQRVNLVVKHDVICFFLVWTLPRFQKANKRWTPSISSNKMISVTVLSAYHPRNRGFTRFCGMNPCLKYSWINSNLLWWKTCGRL